MKKWTIHLVPHTHWDKEWYFTKNVSDIFLIDNLDKIYDIYQHNPNEFDKYTYDGQYSIIDDYLKYYPENMYKIKELLQAKKLVLGPWYTQTDTFNVNGESIVRNLLIGTKSTEKLGGTPMHIGYIPDSFGFNANLPQILTKANLKALIFWRGINQHQLEKGVFNQWVGIDGTIIPIYNMFKWGYGTGAEPLFEHFGHNWNVQDAKLLAKIYLEESEKEIIPTLEKISINTGNIILIPFGNDQIPIFEGYKTFINELNKIDTKHKWILSDYDKFINDVFNKTKLNGLGKINNELRFGQYSRVHKTITSSRYDIKYLNKKLEYLIYDITEPLAIMYEKAGGIYPTNIIELNQKKLLECQAHDSAGACNTDETNNSIIERLNSGIDALESLNNLMTRRILEPYQVEKNDLTIFNFKPYSRNLIQEITVFTKQPSFEIINEQGLPIPFSIRNQKYSCGQNDNFKLVDDTQFNNTQYKLDIENGFYWTTINGEFGDFNALSFKIFKIKEKNQKFELKLNNYENKIENDYFKIELNSNNGHLNLTNKKTNKFIKDAFVLESQFDAGDSYDFSPSKKFLGATNQYINAMSTTFNSFDEKTLVLKYHFKIPNKLESLEMITQELTLKIILKNDNIKFILDINNHIKDFKWVMNCKTEINTHTSWSDTSFGIIERPISIPEMKFWQKENWIDCPIEIEAMESVCWLQNNKESFALTVKGNNEYQIINKNTIALTLFRGYSYIGKPNLAYRIGRASGISKYPYSTPNANLNKPIHIEFNVIINQLDNLIQIAKDNAIQSYYYQKQDLQEYHLKGDSLIIFNNNMFTKIKDCKIDLNLPQNIVVSAFKKSYDNSGYILRLYNASNKTIIFEKSNNWIETDLMENKIESQNEFKPNEVKTFWIKEV